MFTYKVKRPWIWTSSTPTTYPAEFIQTYTGGDLGTARDYSTEVKKGTFPLVTGSVEVSKAPANLQGSAEYEEQFTTANSTYTVYFEHRLEYGLPSFPWDARHDVAEFTLNVVVATQKGGTWDSSYTPGNFVLTIDVGSVLDKVVGKFLTHYQASNQIVAIWKCVGLLRGTGVIKVGFHWDWTWNSSWGTVIEYVVTASASLSTYARSISFNSVSGSSETLVPGGELVLWDSSSQPEP